MTMTIGDDPVCARLKDGWRPGEKGWDDAVAGGRVQMMIGGVIVVVVGGVQKVVVGCGGGGDGTLGGGRVGDMSQVGGCRPDRLIDEANR